MNLPSISLALKGLDVTYLYIPRGAASRSSSPTFDGFWTQKGPICFTSATATGLKDQHLTSDPPELPKALVLALRGLLVLPSRQVHHLDTPTPQRADGRVDDRGPVQAVGNGRALAIVEAFQLTPATRPCRNSFKPDHGFALKEEEPKVISLISSQKTPSMCELQSPRSQDPFGLSLMLSHMSHTPRNNHGCGPRHSNLLWSFQGSNSPLP